MEKSTALGKNRTGVDMSPIDAKEMVALSNSTPPSSQGDARDIAKMRGEYIAEHDALGSIPPPGTLKGVASTAMKKLTGKNPEAFIDKLGCRLAFERTGVRLYEALIAKCSAGAVGASNVSLDTLWEFRNQELQHFKLVEGAICSIGADPTAQTPSADVDGMIALGIVQVLTDPRTSVEQCLDAMLTVELADNAAWELLIEFSTKMGMDDMARDFQGALQQEENHLRQVRQWFRDLTLSDGGVES
jgi:hypothetical protein